MDRIPSEFFYILIIVGIALFQFLLRRFGPQTARPAPAPSDAEPAYPPTVRATSGVAPTPRAAAGTPERPAPSVALVPPGHRFARRSLMGTRRAVQKAMVTATLLGPCRARAPYETR